MNSRPTQLSFLLLAFIVLSQPSLALVLPRSLMRGGSSPTTSYFGSTSFLALMTLKKQLATDNDPSDYDPSAYNELFFDLVTNDRKKELELLLIYMKTFEKDLRIKCKMAMIKNIPDIRTSGERPNYMARCTFLSEIVFRYLHTTIMFYNLEYIVKTVRVMVEAETILMVFEGEDETAGRTRNNLFFATLERVVAESQLAPEKMDWLAKRFNMINYFYGPHLPALFSKAIDPETHELTRTDTPLNDMDQQVLDWAFQVSRTATKYENMRMDKGSKPLGYSSDDMEGLTTSNFFRYYRRGALKPFYDVKRFHMYQQQAPYSAMDEVD